ncbi:NAD-dependent epimerase/dehydratase family protein [Peribacillus asahii]|uniref:NAD-dependent epimerase/dehydratase family protein n=1 Tax=Peribacillus asahii TaxID=228899 RepID=UPI0037F43926
MNKCPSIKTALITGATGFIGSHLVKHLLNAGWDVHIIIRPESNLNLLEKIHHKITIHQHDGSTNGMISILLSVKPNIVFHLASLFLSHHEAKDIEPMIQSNILFGTQLIEAMTATGVYSLINTGTSWQHFQNEPYNPVCLYAATKQAYETILTYYMEISPLKVVTLKLFDTYGPNDPRRKLIPMLQEAAGNQQAIAMSPGNQLIDLVHIDDVCNAFVVAAERLINDDTFGQSEEYAVSSGKPMLLKDIVKTYEAVTGKHLSIEWGKRPYRIREVMIPWNTGRKLPDWEPKIQLEEGIKNLETGNEILE